MLAFLFGNDQYRVREKLLSLREQFFRDFPSGEVRCIDAEEKGNAFQDITIAIQEQSLFAISRFVEIRNAGKLSTQEKKKIVDFLETSFVTSDSAWVVFCEEKPDKRSRFYKILRKIANEVEEYEALKTVQVKKWLEQYVTSQYPHFRFDKKAVDELVLRCGGGDLFFLVNEVKKLTLFAQGRENITQKDVQECVLIESSEAIFALLDELSRKNKKGALALLREQYDQGLDAFSILGMFAYHMRTLLLIYSLYEEKGIRNSQSIAKESGLHPFVVDKTLRNSNTFSLSDVKARMQLLSRLDISAKTGKLDPEFAVEEFILRF